MLHCRSRTSAKKKTAKQIPSHTHTRTISSTHTHSIATPTSTSLSSPHHGLRQSHHRNIRRRHQHGDLPQQQDTQTHGIHTLKTRLSGNVQRSYDELSQYLPPRDHPEYSLRRNWISHLLTHKHTVLPDFVAQLGRSVHLIDVRSEEEIMGPVGYIRGANWFPKSEIDKITSTFPKDGLIAVVCSNDADSRDVVRQLKQTGHNLAAIVAGGMRSWKLMGFSSSRNPAILDRKCVPVSVLHHQEQQRKIIESNKMGQKQMTLEQIISHLGTGDSVQFIKVAAFLTHGRLSCIDGRDDSGIIGAPGGDMGEFIIHLSTTEQLLGQQLTENQISTLFQRRLDAFGRFYMHTDQDSSDRVVNALVNEIDGTIRDKIKDLPPDFAIHTILQDITKDQIEPVLEILTRPDSLGCGHLKFMLTNPEKYRVRHELVKSALKCFFRTRWQGATECDYVVLSGHHEECGVANISLKKEIHSYTKIPLISPSIQNKQIFVNHGQISQYLRHQQCEWFLEQSDVIPFSKTAAAAFQALVDLQAEHHASSTVAKLAHNLPMYTLEFDDDHASCVVHYNGIIGGSPSNAPSTPKVSPPLVGENDAVSNIQVSPQHVHSDSCSHATTKLELPEMPIKSFRRRALECVDGTSKLTVSMP